MRRERAAGNASAARPVSRGATTRYRPPAGRAPSCTKCWQQAHPAANGVDVRFEGADHGATTSPRAPDTNQDDLTFVRVAAPRPRRRSGRRDPHRVRDERRAAGPRPRGAFRLIVPHWYAVASVKWLKRIDVLTETFVGEFQTGHYMYEWADRTHEPVDLDARTGAHHRPGPRIDHRRRHVYGAGKGLVRHGPGDMRRRQPHRRRRVVSGATSSPRKARTSGRNGRSTGRRPHRTAHPARPRHRRGWKRSPKSRPGTGSATATTRSR